MNKQYKHYTDVTREILDTIKIGDLIKINNWKKPMRVMAVSKNYFVMKSKVFKTNYYSVCSKLPWNGVKHNNMTNGMFHCGADDWIFGSPLGITHKNLYEFINEESNRKFLQEFEDGKAHISERNGMPIYDLYIKSNIK